MIQLEWRSWVVNGLMNCSKAAMWVPHIYRNRETCLLEFVIFSSGCSMGFEQLVELKKQLTKEAEQKTAAARRQPKNARGPRTRQTAVDPVVLVIGKLQKRFPATFPRNPAPKVPLKLGILEDILLHAGPLGLSEAEIREALGTWCRGSRYWAALIDGAVRVDLTGAAAGQVTARDSAFARSQTKRARAPGKGGGSAAPETLDSDADPAAA
ncbi:ProQ/FinO family protein [Paraburkholderia sp. GAS42]|uniref:ProQ/FinO family protein n=1 Tax=Paraburkholderia sp. GAS42 TaxID=3035135 RepID=UPI003D210302